MSNQFDDWRTESREDFEHRLHVHDRGARVPDDGGICACGAETTRSVAGMGWQCRDCAEQSMRARYEQQARRA